MTDKSNIENIKNINDERVQEIISQVENDGGTILYVYLRGSHCQGLNTETSDEDYGMFYITKIENLLDLGFNYKEQYADGKNDVYCQELGKFLRLLLKSNPTVLEAIFVDDEFIIYEHPLFHELRENRYMFLTKDCSKPFFGYARSQLIKGQSQNKAVTKPLLSRKTPLDFVYTFHRQGSTPIKKWLEYRGMNQAYCGINNVPNMDMMHDLFYAFGNHFRYENISKEEFLSWYQPWMDYDVILSFKLLDQFEKENDEQNIELAKKGILNGQHQNFIRCIIEHYNISTTDEETTIKELGEFYDREIQKYLPYKGICGDDSEELRLSSVEKDAQPLIHIHYSKDKFSQHCREYKEQQDWIKNRNPERFRQNIENMAKIKNRNEEKGFYDSKNFCALMRLLSCWLEIVRDGKYIVNRRNIDRDYLLSIKRGELTYNEIMEVAKQKIAEAEKYMETCTLPETVDVEFLNKWLLDVRHKQLNGEL